MARELKFQDPGEGIHEGEITDVLVSVGDEVQEGDNVLVVETDKATTDLPSPHSGNVEEIRVKAGDVVKVGDVMMTFASDDEESGEEKKAKETSDQQQAEQEEEEPKKKKSEQRQDEQRQDEPQEGDQQEGAQQDEEQKKDEERKSRRRSGGKAAAVGELPEYEEKKKKAKKKEQPSEEQQAERPVPASPATRRLARELNVDLREIQPSGPHGRVIADDVRAAVEEEKEPSKGQAAEEKEEAEKEKPAEEERPTRAVERPPLPDFEQWGPVEREPLKGIRRQTARQMTLAWQEIPHVTHHDLIDITELERWRRKKAPEIEQTGGRLSLMVLVMKALASVLARHPRFNASLDPESQELILKRYCHLGVAVDTDDGLVVGVVLDVDRQSIGQLAGSVDEMVERVRSRKVSSEELRGSTFTVTNVGPLGGVAFEPLVNYPEVAILGMARARLQQVVTGDFESPETAIRYMLPLSLSYDHRVNDGADAARFVRDLGESLHDPDTLLLNV